MNVQELIEKLQAMPGHLPVHIETDSDVGFGDASGREYLFAQDVEIGNFPTYGRMAVITINSEPK